MSEQNVMNYIDCDVPAELTLVEWRRAHAPAKRRRRGLRSFVPRRPAFAI